MARLEASGPPQSRIGPRRKLLLGGLGLAAAAAGVVAWRSWPEQGFWNPCHARLPRRLATHDLVRAAWDGIDAAQAEITSLAYNVLDEPRITAVGVLLSVALLVQFATFLSDVERRPDGRLGSFALRTRPLVEVVVDFALITVSFLCGS